MGRLLGAWERWVRFTGRPMDPRPLILVRVAVPLCILGDLADMFLRGASGAVLYTEARGGINANLADWYLLGDSPWVGPLLVAAIVLSMPWIAVGGRLCRPAIVVGLLATSQLGHFYQPGDRAIDRLLRTTLLLLLFSEVTAPRIRARVAAWPDDLLRLWLFLIYLAAGFAKLSGSMGWWHPGHPPELLNILADPLAGKLDNDFWIQHPWPFVLGGWVTMVLEFTPILIFTRWSRYWAVFGAIMHLGIFAMMYLGMFSLGMLAFYPLLFSPWTEQVLDRLGWTLGADADESLDPAAAPARGL